MFVGVFNTLKRTCGSGYRELCTFSFAVLVLFTVMCAPVFAQSAAVTITNTAKVIYTHGDDTSELLSNTVSTSVLPLVDVSNREIEVLEGRIDGGADGLLYSFKVSNPGNGRDTFDLLADFTNISDRIAGIWLDVDADGRLSAGDSRISSSSITLAAGQAVRILVTAAVPGDMELRATSLNTDPNAIIAHRSATAHIAANRSRQPVESRASLEKTQVIDTVGATRPGPGTLITYSLAARLPAGLEASDIQVTDTIPAGTSYVPGSLTLDGAVLSDTVCFTPSTGLIAVALSGASVQSDTIHTIRFKVRIN